MASAMMEALMALCQEKHIDELYLLDRLEQSLAQSYASLMHLDWGAKVTIDRMTGKIYVYKLVPIDDSMDDPLEGGRRTLHAFPDLWHGIKAVPEV